MVELNVAGIMPANYRERLVDLLEMHHADGRPVSFDRHTILLIEPHESGTGTLVTVGSAERSRDLHLREDYAHVHEEATMSLIDRAVRDMTSGKIKVPF